MYFRTKNTPSGTVLQLTESYRNSEGQPRQRVVISLGDAAIADSDKTLIAKAVERALRGEDQLLQVEAPPAVHEWTELIVRRIRARAGQTLRANPSPAPATVVDGVLLDEVTHDSTALLGGVLVAHEAWERLGMDQCLDQLGFNPAQRSAAALNVINRLVDPVSDNALADWVSSTALPELMGAGVLGCPRDRFYRASDALLDKRREIEAHLRRRQKELFGLDRTLVLYDLTNTYFEGEAAANAKARRGKSKEKRDDCPQLVVAMAFDEHGFELAHEVFQGGTSDSKTLPAMIEQLRNSLADEEDGFLQNRQPLVILDGGIATKANRDFLREEKLSYLVNETRTGRIKWADQFREDGAFQLIEGRDGRSPVRVRLLEQGDEHILLCKSEGRRDKELAIRSRAETRFLEELEALAARIVSGKLKDPVRIERTVGKLLSRHTRMARFYEVKFETEPAAKLAWTSRGERREANDDLLGCYVLRCDCPPTLDPARLWEIYMTLSRAEDGFRCLKSDLGLRPVRHHREERGDGHIFISVLAYHLLRQTLYQLEQAGDHRSWETVRRILQTHVYVTVSVPTLAQGTWRVRRAGQPDAIQKELYSRLEIDWKALPVTKELVAPGETATL